MCRDGLLAPVCPDHYLRADVAHLPAARRRLLAGLLPKGTLAGLSTAAWALGGPDLDGTAPLHALAVPHTRGGRSGVEIHRLRFSAEHVITVDGLRLTTPTRTAADLILVGASSDDAALCWLMTTLQVSPTDVSEQLRSRARGATRARALAILTNLQNGSQRPIREVASTG